MKKATLDAEAKAKASKELALANGKVEKKEWVKAQKTKVAPKAAPKATPKKANLQGQGLRRLQEEADALNCDDQYAVDNDASAYQTCLAAENDAADEDASEEEDAALDCDEQYAVDDDSNAYQECKIAENAADDASEEEDAALNCDDQYAVDNDASAYQTCLAAENDAANADEDSDAAETVDTYDASDEYENFIADGFCSSLSEFCN